MLKSNKIKQNNVSAIDIELCLSNSKLECMPNSKHWNPLTHHFDTFHCMYLHGCNLFIDLFFNFFFFLFCCLIARNGIVIALVFFYISLFVVWFCVFIFNRLCNIVCNSHARKQNARAKCTLVWRLWLKYIWNVLFSFLFLSLSQHV